MMISPRLALSLTIVASLIGVFNALASAQDGFQKAVPKRLGFGKATATAPDPVLDWQPIEVASNGQQSSSPVATAGSVSDAALPPSPVQPRPPATRSYEAASKAAVTTQPTVNFVAPQAIRGGCAEGCAPTQQGAALSCGNGTCGTCDPCSGPSHCACDSCTMAAATQQPQRRRRFKSFQRKREARLAAKQRALNKRRRQRWWPWLATSDMPAPTECGCADCTGVTVSNRAGVLVAPVEVTPGTGVVDRHQFTNISDLGHAEPQAEPFLKRFTKPLRKIPFMNLDNADDDTASVAPNRIQRVGQRTSKVANRVRRATARFEARASAAAPTQVGDWTSGSK